MPGSQTFTRQFHHHQQPDWFPTAPDALVFVNDADNGLFTETDPPGLLVQTILQLAQPGRTWRKQFQHSQQPYLFPTAADTSDFINDADNFAGAESDPSTIKLSSTDAGAGAETNVIALSSADTGSGADTGTQIGLAAAETGTGSDAAAPTIGIAQPDTGSAADASAITASLTSAEAGSGSDAGTQVGVGAADAGTAAEADSLTAGSTSTDVGAGAESDPSKIALADLDAASAVDIGSVLFEVMDSDGLHGEDSGYSFFSDADAMAGSEVVLRLVVVAADAVSAVDSGYQSGPFTDTDAASAAEVARLTGAAFTDTDAASAAESATVGPLNAGSGDAGSGAEANAAFGVYAGISAALITASHGHYRIVAPGHRTVVAGRLDRAMLELARVIEESVSVEFLSDADRGSASDGAGCQRAEASLFWSPALGSLVINARAPGQPEAVLHGPHGSFLVPLKGEGQLHAHVPVTDPEGEWRLLVSGAEAFLVVR